MPCNTYQGNDIDLFLKYESHGESLANMLCRVLSKIDGQETYHISEFGEDIQKWYEDHKEWDEKRKVKVEEINK